MSMPFLSLYTIKEKERERDRVRKIFDYDHDEMRFEFMKDWGAEMRERLFIWELWNILFIFHDIIFNLHIFPHMSIKKNFYFYFIVKFIYIIYIELSFLYIYIYLYFSFSVIFQKVFKLFPSHKNMLYIWERI